MKRRERHGLTEVVGFVPQRLAQAMAAAFLH